MKAILYVNPTAIHGGAEEALLRTMIAAQELGYCPVLVVPRPGWLTEAAAAQHIAYELLPTLPDVTQHEDWRGQFKPWPWNGYRIAQLARKRHAVIVHSNTPRAAYHGGLGARLARVKAITHVHDIVNLPYASPLKANLLRGLTDSTVVCSQAVARVVGGFTPALHSSIQTLYYGWNQTIYADVQPINLQREFNFSPNTLIIGNVSAMTPWKGQDILIEAFRVLYKTRPDLRLLIVGGSQGTKQQDMYEENLHRKVTEYSLQEAVVFTGWREDVWSLMKSFDIFVHVPTQPDPLPTALLHACALGQAIVGSSIGGVPEIVLANQTGLLVPPNNSPALVDALSTLSANPPMRTAFRQAAQQHFVQRFSHEQMRTGLDYIYQQCLNVQ